MIVDRFSLLAARSRSSFLAPVADCHLSQGFERDVLLDPVEIDPPAALTINAVAALMTSSSTSCVARRPVSARLHSLVKTHIMLRMNLSSQPRLASVSGEGTGMSTGMFARLLSSLTSLSQPLLQPAGSASCSSRCWHVRYCPSVSRIEVSRAKGNVVKRTQADSETQQLPSRRQLRQY